MPIPVACHCGKKLQAPDALAGRQARCPSCSSLIDVPRPASLGTPVEPIFDSPRIPLPPAPPPPAVHRPAAASPPRAPAPAKRSAGASGVERCEFCGGAMSISGVEVHSIFDLHGAGGKAAGGVTAILAFILVRVLGACVCLSILLGLAAIALFIKGVTLRYRCSQCLLGPSGMLPEGASSALSRQRLKTLAGAGGAGFGSVASIALGIGLLLWVAEQEAPSAPPYPSSWNADSGDSGGSGGDEAPPARREPTPSERLSDPDPAVRRAALEEVSGDRSDKATALLRRCLRDDDPSIRRDVVVALDGRLEIEDAKVFLLVLRTERDPGVKAAAAAALDRLGPAAWVGALESDDTRSTAEEAIRKAGPSVVPALVASLENRDFDVRRSAATLLIELTGREQVASILPVLEMAMNMRDWRGHSRWAVDAYVRLGDPESRAVIPVLATIVLTEGELGLWSAGILAKFEDPGPEAATDALVRAAVNDGVDEQVRELAFQALAHVGAPATEAIAKRLLEGAGGYKERYASLLDRLDPKARAERVVAALEDPAATDRLTALQLLADLPPDAIDAEKRLSLLVGLLDQGNLGRYAFQALGKLGPAAAPAAAEVVKRLDGPSSHDASSALEAMGPAIIPDLIAGFSSRSDSQKAKILNLLHGHGAQARPAIRILVDALDDDKLDDVAENVLAKIGEPAVPALVDVLENGSDAAKESAMDALERMGGGAAAPAVPTLVEIHLTGKVDRLRNLSFNTLNEIQDGVVPAARKYLDHKEVEVRERALNLILRFGEEAIPAVIDALEDKESRIRSTAVRCLGDYGPAAKEAVKALTKLLSDPDPSIRRGACSSLGQIGPDAKSALPALRKLAADGQYKYQAEQAILKIEEREE